MNACALCETTTDQRVLYVDDTIAVFGRSDSVLVAPRQHVPTLAHLPDSALGAFLGALRRVCLTVEASYGVGASRIDVIRGEVAAPLHVSLRITPQRIAMTDHDVIDPSGGGRRRVPTTHPLRHLTYDRAHRGDA